MRAMGIYLKFKICVFLCVLTILWACEASAQISADGASFTGQTQYGGGASRQDPVYVFNDPSAGGNIGELKVVASDGSGGWTYAWTKYDASASDFTVPVGSASDVSGVADGGYKVTLDKGSEHEEYYAWVFNNYNTVVFSFKKKDCGGVEFEGATTKKALIYYDLFSGEVLNFSSGDPDVFVLKRENEDVNLVNMAGYDGSVLSLVDSGAFDGEESYLLEVTDEFGSIWRSATISSDTYVAKAAFTVEPTEGEAPLEDVTFVNNSINADQYEWYLFKNEADISESVPLQDSLLVDVIDQETPMAYTYLHPGEFQIRLVVKNTSEGDVCADKVELDKLIKVDSSLVDMPNFITPNGDGKNDEFRVKARSLKSFRCVIFNRWGKELYVFHDSNGGWNGKIGGKYASPGTYFYVIEATGRENDKIKYVKKGTFTLIRGR